jgi:2-polyprenyl-6-methoxyphenol hydroxylase-like FAD-dependent oxidoreductase
VVLLGDAAHPTTPNLGQGGCMAIEDAAVLGRLLPAAGAAGVAGALRQYEDRRIARANEVVERSWSLGRVAQIENSLGRAVRDTAVRWTPESVMRSRMLEFFRFSAG